MASDHLSTPPTAGVPVLPRNDDPIPAEVTAQIWERDGGLCQKCLPETSLQRHHIVLRLDGGPNTPENLILLCSACHTLWHWYKERTWSGKFEKLSQYEEVGRATSAGARNTPYGYRYIAPEKKGMDGVWERHPDQWRTVLWIFQQVALHQGGTIVATLLNKKGTPPPRGGEWNAAAIRRIVRRTAYIGQLKRRMEDQEFTFAVPRIVPDDLFALANEQIDGNRKTARRNAKHEYLLSSSKEEPLLCCGVCQEQGKDYLMGGRAKGRPQNTKPWLHYRCNNARGIDHSVSAQQLEAAIWEALVGMLTDPTLVLENIKKLSEAASAQSLDLQEERVGLEERAGEIRAAQVRLAEAITWGKLPRDILEHQAEALEEEAQQIGGHISLLHVQVAQAEAETVPIRDIEDACALLREGAEGATFEERRWIVRTLVDRIYADKKCWTLEGRLPGLRAQGSLGVSSGKREIGEQPAWR